MKTLKFKTNVQCAACVATITPAMNQLPLDNWNVDLKNPDRTLTILGDVDSGKVIKVLNNSGYQGESI